MSLRVIAGKAKGRTLKPVPGDTTRPIMDRVKESLFNIIGMDILDAHFLDLFAGTGSVGIEALSRGAAFALFCDTEKAAITTIESNLQVTRFTASASVQQIDAFTLLNATPEHRFDFIYIAPPQYGELWKQSLLALEENTAWLAHSPTVIVQIDPQERETLSLTMLTQTDERRYGKTMLLFYTPRTGIQANSPL